MPQGLRKAQDLGTIRNPERRPPCFSSKPPRHSSFRLGLSSPSPCSAGTATRRPWVYMLQGQVSLRLSWNCVSFAATSTLAGRTGDQVQNCSQSSVACRRGLTVGRREPVTHGLRKAESAPPSHKSGNTAVGADIFSHFFFLVTLKKMKWNCLWEKQN